MCSWGAYLPLYLPSVLSRVIGLGTDVIYVFEGQEFYIFLMKGEKV